MTEKCQTICVIDDDPEVCKALSRVLRLAGFNVQSYRSGQAWLDDGQMGTIDLLLLDIKMPVMDGFALRDHLSAAGFSIPIVFMTAHEAERMQSRIMGKGVAAFLQKPIDEKDLLEAIRIGLKKAPAQKDLHP